MTPVHGLARSDSETTGTSFATDLNEKSEKSVVARAPHNDLNVISEADEDANVGYTAYKQGVVENHEITAQENRSIRWRLDLIILPMFLITQTLQFLDVRGPLLG
jgi:hypothetical protein